MCVLARGELTGEQADHLRSRWAVRPLGRGLAGGGWLSNAAWEALRQLPHRRTESFGLEERVRHFPW
ncbi:MAG: hypothetical protein ACLS63_00625 [Flavonifractor plautii]